MLGEFEEMLAPYNFFRVHNSSYQFNLLKKYIRGEGAQVITQNGEVIDVLRRKKEDFLKALLINRKAGVRFRITRLVASLMVFINST